MIYGLYHSAAGMLTNEYRQSTLANNLANADTIGFKRDIASFAERRPADIAGIRSGPANETLGGLSGGLWLGQTTTDFSAGSTMYTGEPLDVALDGPGFLLTESNGKTLATRDGRMVMDSLGRLVAASDGASMLGSAGQPIVLNPNGGRPFIDEDGRILQHDAVVGRLGLVDYENYDALRKVGTNRFDAGEAATIPVTALVRSGLLENSGSQPVTELVSMIEATRAYQLNAQMLSLQDGTARRLISTVAA